MPEGDTIHRAGARIGAALVGREIVAIETPQPRHALDEAWVYGREGRPCRRCGTPVQARGQGDDNRATYRCPGCQA